MNRHELVDKLRAHKPELMIQDIESLALFGSLAREDANPESDVDLLFEYRRPFGLFEYARTQRLLESILNDSKIDNDIPQIVPLSISLLEKEKEN